MTAQFQDKFIAFIDVLGFKNMVADAEAGKGRTLDELLEILTQMNRQKDKAFFAAHGPQICPCSKFVSKDLDFEITQLSDSLLVSAEVSAAGVINLVQTAWAVALTLLPKGVLVRGYITRGSIYHHGNEFLGSGYQTAIAKEPNVSAFRVDADDTGTPFIEIDPTVTDYVRDESDACVREMFSRCVRTEDELTAVFPFKRLSHSFAISRMDATREKTSNDIVRKQLVTYRNKVAGFADESNSRVMKKIAQYLAAIDAQLDICDKTDDFIEQLGRPIGRRP